MPRSRDLTIPILALCLAGLLAPPAAAAPSPRAPARPAAEETAETDPVAALRAEMERLRRDYEERLSELETRLAELEARPEPTAPKAEAPAAELADLRAAAEAAAAEAAREAGAPPPTGAEAGEPAYGRARNLNRLNPEISMTGNVLALTSSDAREEIRLQEFELDVQAPLDPFSTTRWTLAFSEEEGVGIEEGYVAYPTLKTGLGLTAGKFRQSFGALNRQHLHALPQSEYPLALETYFDEEGLAQTGVSLEWLLPRGWANTNRLTLQVTDGSNEAFGGEDFERLAVLGRLTNYWDLSRATYLELGLSGIAGDDGAGGDSRVWGADLTIDWAPPGRSKYREVLWRTEVLFSERDDPETLAVNLLGKPDASARAFERTRELGPEAVIAAVESSGLQGRGGAGFPAHVKWKGVRSQAETERYVVLNADEGEPGTFKDREVLLRRPDLVIEGLAIAAWAVGASEVYLYLRGEFEVPWGVVERSIAELGPLFPGISFHMHAGHGAYICGEETALLEALEGKRGMPRLKPPFPTEYGLWGKPTLMHNVETIACVPSIVLRGGEWFRGLGRTEAGSKLYCVSGHVQRPGTYELPLGVTLDELVEEAGGYEGTLKAFSPGGASSGFLPASERTRPLAFKSLAEAGSMLGSAGVVVLNDTVDVAWAVGEQLRFFEDESCGQCAPCRIGTRYLRESLDRHRQGEGGGREALAKVADAAWQMNEGSICGLGQAAPLPLTTALEHFPEDFEA